MSVITSEMARGTRSACPVCGASNHSCGASSSTEQPVVRRGDHRRRSGKMTRAVRQINGREVLVQVPIYLDEDEDQEPGTKKRPPAKDKKVRAPDPAETPEDDGRPIPKIRTK